MASKTYTQAYEDGTIKAVRRSVRQGRKPTGLGRAEKFRLYESDNKRLETLKEVLGYFFNKNEIVIDAVKMYLDNYVPTESVKS